MADEEEIFEEDVAEATRRSLMENYAVEGESSRHVAGTDAEEEDDDEELVDYGSTPELPSHHLIRPQKSCKRCKKNLC